MRRDPRFLALAAARDAYAVIVAGGGWAQLPDDLSLKPDAASPLTPVLRQRLAIEGYIAPVPEKPEVYDPALVEALKSFQSHHGLAADGVVAARTIAELNVPAETRLEAIEANLERARWLPSPLPPDRIEVDTGAPQATLYRNGVTALTMRAIVGRPDRRTPTFSTRVVSVKFNPPWIVPAGIAAREVLPKGSRYLRRGGFYVVGGQVIQRPGPKAALGYIKFEMPDPFTVYMHDTPSRSLFAKERRWLSHGCMRLENPRDLAASVLGWDRKAVDAAIASGQTRAFPVQAQTPVYVVYRTAVPDADGHMTFRADVYGWDAKIIAALRKLT